jgi:hypothetical protein
MPRASTIVDRGHGRRWSYFRNYFLLRHYRLTYDEYARLLTTQAGRCAICLQPSTKEVELHVDHDHASDEIRGLLCSSCNTALGSFGDDPKRLTNALAYLAAPRPTVARVEPPTQLSLPAEEGEPCG